MPPLCPGIGGTTQIWGEGTLKKNSGASLCPQLQNRVGAYDFNSVTVSRKK